MCGLMGQHRLHLVGAVEPHQQARMQEHMPRVGHEGVHRPVVDDDDPRALRQARLAENRCRKFPQRAFDLGVADDGLCRPRVGATASTHASAVARNSLLSVAAIDDPLPGWFDTGVPFRAFSRAAHTE
jgi:hypothetical protein